MTDTEIMDRHHLLEIILWPNGDGTFTEIRNSAKRLEELGIYKDYKMTILLPHSEHMSLHRAGQTHSDETKKKMSEAKKGRPFSDEHRRKLSEAHKGQTLSDETRRKISEARKCKPHSDETRRKIAESMKGKTMSAEQKQKLSEASRAYWARRKAQA